MAAENKVEKFDFIAIGSGEAGKLVPWTLSGKHGQKSAVIERGQLGGSCPNVACLPSKTVIHSASVAHDLRMAYQHGAAAAEISDLKIDMTKVRERKRDQVNGVGGFQGVYEATGVEIIRGEGKFIGPKTVQVGDRKLTATNILINTGSRARVDPSIPGLVASKPLTHVELLEIDALPKHLIILGGGYVGLEFAQAYRRFGAEVTVIQRNKQVLPEEDSDIVANLVTVLEREGVKILTSTEVVSVSGTSGDAVTVKLASKDGRADPAPVQGSHLLVSAGRIPNTNDMGLELAGIKTTSTGHVAVDAQLQSSVPGVYAAGDCAGSPYFTHIGWDDNRIVTRAILGDPRPGGKEGRLVPRALFTAPEVARLGLTEREAQEKGIKYRLSTLGMDMFLRTRTLNPGDTEGFAKALVEADGDKILGFAAVGPGASELLAVVTLAMKLGVSYREIEDLIIVHPTLNEGLVMLFQEVPARK